MRGSTVPSLFPQLAFPGTTYLSKVLLAFLGCDQVFPNGNTLAYSSESQTILNDLYDVGTLNAFKQWTDI